jgi:hypothetical protein
MLTDHGKEDIKQIWLTYHSERSQVASIIDVRI